MSYLASSHVKVFICPWNLKYPRRGDVDDAGIGDRRRETMPEASARATQ
jgi:hypothetical protein